MQNQTTNAANKNFNVNIAGTSNLTSSLGANTIATKGHYYGISEEVSDSLPQISNSNLEVMTGDANTDDTQIGVEKYTGARVFSKERIFMNMVFKGG